MTTVFEVLHKKAEPYKVTLTRGQKGGYGWEITVSAQTWEMSIAELVDADTAMRRQFGGGDGHE